MKNKTKTPEFTKESKRKYTLTALLLFKLEDISSKKFCQNLG